MSVMVKIRDWKSSTRNMGNTTLYSGVRLGYGEFL